MLTPGSALCPQGPRVCHVQMASTLEGSVRTGHVGVPGSLGSDHLQGWITCHHWHLGPGVTYHPKCKLCPYNSSALSCHRQRGSGCSERELGCLGALGSCFTLSLGGLEGGVSSVNFSDPTFHRRQHCPINRVHDVLRSGFILLLVKVPGGRDTTHVSARGSKKHQQTMVLSCMWHKGFLWLLLFYSVL